ncbi:MAG: hypothetical protein RLZZ546_573 [Bacteroidota bacterium]|jgi:hypothetical protein
MSNEKWSVILLAIFFLRISYIKEVEKYFSNIIIGKMEFHINFYSNV